MHAKICLIVFIPLIYLLSGCQLQNIAPSDFDSNLIGVVSRSNASEAAVAYPRVDQLLVADVAALLADDLIPVGVLASRSNRQIAILAYSKSSPPTGSSDSGDRVVVFLSGGYAVSHKLYKLPSLARRLVDITPESLVVRSHQAFTRGWEINLINQEISDVDHVEIGDRFLGETIVTTNSNSLQYESPSEQFEINLAGKSASQRALFTKSVRSKVRLYKAIRDDSGWRYGFGEDESTLILIRPSTRSIHFIKSSGLVFMGACIVVVKNETDQLLYKLAESKIELIGTIPLSYHPIVDVSADGRWLLIKSLIRLYDLRGSPGWLVFRAPTPTGDAGELVDTGIPTSFPLMFVPRPGQEK